MGIVYEASRKINRMIKTTIRTAIQQLEYVSVVDRQVLAYFPNKQSTQTEMESNEIDQRLENTNLRSF